MEYIPLNEQQNDIHVELAKAGKSALKETSDPQTLSEEFSPEPEGQLTIDVFQTPTEIVVESAVAGVRAEDIDISVTNDSVTIKGQRHREKRVKDEDYLYQECYWGRFSRSVILPQEVDAQEATSTFKNGILTIHLPKLNRQKLKRLKVRSD